MGETSPYDIKVDYDLEETAATVEIGETLRFRAGRHIAIEKVTATLFLHAESLIYYLDDFAIDPETGNVVPEMSAVGAWPKHMTVAGTMGSSNAFTYPKQYTAKNKSEVIYWYLSVPSRQAKVNDNAGPFKFINLYIPKQEKLKFSIISISRDIDTIRKDSDIINGLDKYEKNRVCGKGHGFWGCRIFR